MTLRLSRAAAQHLCFALTVALLATLAPSVPCTAQDEPAADGYPVDIELRRKRREIESTLRGIKDELGDREKLFNDFFQKYDLPRFTTSDERDDLPQLRLELKEKFQLAARNTKIREHLSNLVLQFMYKVAADKELHAAARINAVLVIGDLDSPTTGRGGTDPWMTVMPQLLNIAGAAGAPDGMRVAAIVGIRRRTAQLDQLEEKARGRMVLAIAKPMMGMAIEKDPPGGRSDAGHVWMRRMAMETLGDLNTVGQNYSIFRPLFAIAKDPKESIDVRTAAVEAIARMPLTDQEKFDPRPVGAAIADIVMEATREELARTPESQPGYKPQRLVARIEGPLKSAQAMLRLGTAEQRQIVDRIEQYLAALQGHAGNEEIDEEEQRRRLEQLVGRLQAELEARGLILKPADDTVESPEPTPPADGS